VEESCDVSDTGGRWVTAQKRRVDRIEVWELVMDGMTGIWCLSHPDRDMEIVAGRSSISGCGEGWKY
jgi:hypothetical protein